MRCEICSKVIKYPHNSVRKTEDRYCQTCLVITERIIHYGRFALIANSKESPSYLCSYNKSPHWTCQCGVHNHETRVKCLGCNRDSDYS